jgi:hypothetical protein
VRPRVLLLVCEPGSGKSTLGRALGAALHVPFLARDDVRRGRFLTAGAWDDATAATDAFLDVLETMAGLGITCVAEYVVRAAEPEPLRRITTAADCVVVRTVCADAPSRRARRDCADPLLQRMGADAEVVRATRMQAVTDAMQLDFGDLPTLVVDTTDGYDPPLEAIVAFALS